MGRLQVVTKMAKSKKFTLNVGCKNVKIGNVNIDIDAQSRPDIVADTRWLPFKLEIFERAFFTDVLEHVPRKDEVRALKEINRVLKKNGVLILSVPHSNSLFTLLDPAHYVMKHRHYKKQDSDRCLTLANFTVKYSFTSGWIGACLDRCFYCFFLFPIKMLANRANERVHPINSFNKLRNIADKEYKKNYVNGYTLFVKAKKT